MGSSISSAKCKLVYINSLNAWSIEDRNTKDPLNFNSLQKQVMC